MRTGVPVACARGDESAQRRRLRLAPDPLPWFATPPATSPRERRRELEDEHSRLLAHAVGDHLPFELAQRAAEIAAELNTGQNREW
jgi:hypothetical protein